MKPGQQGDDAYTRWLAAEIQAAIDDPRPSIPHEEVMARMDAQLARLSAPKYCDKNLNLRRASSLRPPPASPADKTGSLNP